MSQSTWEKTKRVSKQGFDKAWKTVDKLGAPVNRLSNKLGAEAFWPMAIDKESDKAARILRSFCKDGFYAPESEVYTDENGKINRPKGKQRVIKKIPAQVIKNAKGIAIFTTMRTGLWISGSGGSGVLMARVPETGEWSPPSGIMLHTAGVGFLAGVDIYDCVVIINTIEALEAFKKVRCTLGGEVSVAAGPVGMGGVLDSEVHKRQAPIWTYMKSKGLYAGVAVDGTIIIERTDENERFYGERISVHEILAGKARHPPASINTLLQTLKAAQGDSDVDETQIPPPGETPGDLELNEDQTGFGVPASDDPDPYGVKALEAEGLFIREAGTKVRPSPDVFEFRPNPSSPVYATFARRSLDSSPRNSWRASVQSYMSVDRGTQTDDAPLTATTSVSRASSRSAKGSTDVPAPNPWEEDGSRWDIVPIHGGEEREKQEEEHEKHGVSEEKSLKQADGHADVEEHEAVESDDDFEVHEVTNATMTKQENAAQEHTDASESRRMSPTFTRAKLVTINKRPTPPALPPRHPRHTWGSGSSRDSTSPTALSQSSHSTQPTEATQEPVESFETFNDATVHPSNVKTLQTSAVLPEVVDEDDLAESDTEITADKDEFLSANGDQEEESTQDDELVNEVATLQAIDADTDSKQSLLIVTDPTKETDVKDEKEQLLVDQNKDESKADQAEEAPDSPEEALQELKEKLHEPNLDTPQIDKSQSTNARDDEISPKTLSS
ncbi:hypothetical protein N7462_003476 [Penicillium macrosclerotiorum]|uniref:uncharacterized protein n=1 Tax=Penicillium macrosclerotiorum TaxID=303699 RepID=UPI002547AEE9|nr:uncharacterized protein N7462_003476 [Penicillium macrosclerotiorum]KAJ5689084.1 hypothetical protein N7462_003476 [Penicillium macrosclerotiorum]